MPWCWNILTSSCGRLWTQWGWWRSGRGSNPSPHDKQNVGPPPPCGPPSPLRRGKLFFVRVRVARYFHPSPRGEGGPRHAFSPAVAGRLRGHSRHLRHRLLTTHIYGVGVMRPSGFFWGYRHRPSAVGGEPLKYLIFALYSPIISYVIGRVNLAVPNSRFALSNRAGLYELRYKRSLSTYGGPRTTRK